MKSTDRAIVVGIALLGLLAAFWFLILAPKRAEVSDLDGQVTDLQASLTSAEQSATAAEQAKGEYASNYHRLVVLGKAVPAEEETSSLLVEVQALAAKSGISFTSIELSQSGGSNPVTAPAAQQTTADPNSQQASGSLPEGAAPTAGGDAASSPATAASATPVSAAPTEAAAAVLPLGATVGPAGLPVMPYDMHFSGDFFAVADFIRGLDSLVSPASKQIGVDGRLLTIDGFSFGPDQKRGFPHLVASLQVTTYVAPADQGVTAGATLETPPATVPTSTPTATSGTAPAATATPPTTPTATPTSSTTP